MIEARSRRREAARRTRNAPPQSRCGAPGGELQRIALVRALLCRPRFLFADEPSSRLDPIAQRRLMELLGELAQVDRVGILLVSHDRELASAMCRRVHRIAGPGVDRRAG